MEINQRWAYVDGTFDTETAELICIPSHKYRSVDICIKGPMHIGFAQIKLYSGNKFVDADAVYNDAVALGEEIARRWNAEAKKNSP